jgi:putative membrane protein
MSPEIQAFASGFPLIMLHAGVSLALLAVGGLVHSLLSPMHEIRLIREGNAAAAASFAGVIGGLAMALAASVAASTSVFEVGLWGVVAVALELFAFRIVDMVFAGLPQRVREGEVAAAWVLVAAKLSVALIFSAALFG